MPTAADVLAFWFGTNELAAEPAPDARRKWFAGGEAFDRVVVTRFTAMFERPAEVQAWAVTLPGALAAVIVFDQLARNAFRGTARAFAYDARALPIAKALVDDGEDRHFGPAQRAFLYMPFQHAEDLAAQDRAVALFSALAASLPGDERVAVWRDFAVRHRAIVARFGRFPGRNRALGRADTPEEAAWLAEGGETFGQG